MNVASVVVVQYPASLAWLSPSQSPPGPSFDKRPEMYKVLRATTQTADDVERLFGNAMFSRYRTVLQAFRQCVASVSVVHHAAG